MIKRFLPIFLFAGTTGVSHAEGPSFDCRRAQTPDEITICSDARLSELDRLYARDFKLLKEKDKAQAAEQARSFLKIRRLCGNDRYCILETMEYLPGGTPKPSWLTDAYKAQLARAVAEEDLTPRALAAVGTTGSFPTSNKGIQATVVAIDGANTAHAVATAVTTEADVREYCDRDPGGETTEHGGKLSVRGCVSQEMRSVKENRITSRANCAARFLMLGNQRWTVIGFSDVGITWKDPDGEEQQSSGITAAEDGQLQLLCPNLYARLRANPTPDTDAGPATPTPSGDVEVAATVVREILSRDLSPVLNSNDKEGDDQKFMTPDLYRRFEKGARDFDADPYTGGQDTTGMKVDDVTSVPLDPYHAVVTVTFSFEHDASKLKRAYHMVSNGGRWLVDDIDYLEDKTTMRGILAKASQ